MQKRRYPSDLTDAQWEIIRLLLPPTGSGTASGGRPVAVDKRDIINALLYLNRTGCQWRMLPREFPNWKTVHWYFSRWTKVGTWRRVNEALVKGGRQAAGKNAAPSVGIIDSQSVKTTEEGGALVGFDAGKKMKGRKRSIVVDTLRLLLAVCVHRGDAQDRAGAPPTIASLKRAGRKLKENFADGAYAGQLQEWARDSGGWVPEVVRWPEIRKFAELPKRWIVERTFGWLGRVRRLSKHYERLARHAESFIYLRMTELMLRRLA